MKVTDLVQEKFPELTICETIDNSQRSKLNERKDWDNQVNPWIKWFADDKSVFSWLRIQLSDDRELIFKKVSLNTFLIVLNKNENTPLLLSFLKKIPISISDEETSKKEKPKELEEKAIAPDEVDLKMQDAVRIQKLIIPRDEDIRKNFKEFFVVHQQQDVVGGDFYWYKETEDCTLLALIDCTGHSVEGAMTSMVCNSLLHQAASSFDKDNFPNFVETFYEMLNKYNETSEDMLDYGIGAEVGVFCFDFETKKINFISTGISAFVKKDDGVELLKYRKIKDHTKAVTDLVVTELDMNNVSGIYSFTDGLTDQFDASDKKKMGYKGVKKMIEAGKGFETNYYKEEINKWKGENMQYDDITLFGLAI